MSISAIYSTGATNGTIAGGNFTLTPPNSSAQAGDVAIVVAAVRTQSIDIGGIADTATGTKSFTELRQGSQGGLCSTTIWYRVLQAGDPGVGNTNTWTVTNTVTTVEAALLVYRGVDNTTPIDAQGTTNTGSSPVTFNSVTTVTDGAMFVGGMAWGNGTAPLSAQTSGSPTLTLRANDAQNGSGTKKEGVGVVDGIITTAGATGSFVWSMTASGTFASDSFALRPAGATTPTNLFFSMFD